jgi:hypothetical protein
VSLSWPEKLRAGLFPGRCWLQGRRAVTTHSLSLAPSIGSTGLLRAMETMLDERADVLRKGSRLTVTVSDSAAAITTLPWHDALHRTAELESYARICFEKQGIVVDGDWVLRVAFRRYRETGIAYALPRDWLVELAQSTSARGLRLTTVLPLTAAAYFESQFRRTGEVALQMLREENHASALIYSGASLVGRDVEPVTASGIESGVRLLRRVSASHSNIARVVEWSSESPEHSAWS